MQYRSVDLSFPLLQDTFPTGIQEVDQRLRSVEVSLVVDLGRSPILLASDTVLMFSEIICHVCFQ